MLSTNSRQFLTFFFLKNAKTAFLKFLKFFLSTSNELNFETLASACVSGNFGNVMIQEGGLIIMTTTRTILKE